MPTSMRRDTTPSRSSSTRKRCVGVGELGRKAARSAPYCARATTTAQAATKASQAAMRQRPATSILGDLHHRAVALRFLHLDGVDARAAAGDADQADDLVHLAVARREVQLPARLLA